MKKMVLLLVAIFMIGSNAIAQTKTAYCDIYVRGGGRNLRICVMYDNQVIELDNRSHMAKILNYMANEGWELDQNIIVPRHPWYSYLTRHKLHLIFKKEYQNGENPYIIFKNGDALNMCFNLEQREVENFKIGAKCIYNGSPVKVCSIQGNKVTITPIQLKYGNWVECIAHCKSLGAEWYIPNHNELKKLPIPKDGRIPAYWAGDITKSYDIIPIYNRRDGKNKERYQQPSSKALICPIAIVDKSKLK